MRLIDGLVTTVIPVRDRASLLPDAIASVLAQTHEAVEVVVVDDGSTDETARVANEIAAGARGRVTVLRSDRPRGPGASRQRGLEAGRGEFVQYLDSDDTLHPRKLEVQVRAMRDDPDVGASYGPTDWRDGSGRAAPPPGACGRVRVDRAFPALLRGRLWDTQAPLYRRSLLDRVGPWGSLRAEEDWEYDARLGALGTRLHHVEDVVATTRRHALGHASRFGGRGLRLRDRARARERILASARRAGCADDSEEMRHFARSLFLLARQCAAAGLRPEADRLLGLARGADRGAGRDYALFEGVARAAGWRTAGLLAAGFDRLRAGARR